MPLGRGERSAPRCAGCFRAGGRSAGSFSTAKTPPRAQPAASRPRSRCRAQVPDRVAGAMRAGPGEARRRLGVHRVFADREGGKAQGQGGLGEWCVSRTVLRGEKAVSGGARCPGGVPLSARAMFSNTCWTNPGRPGRARTGQGQGVFTGGIHGGPPPAHERPERGVIVAAVQADGRESSKGRPRRAAMAATSVDSGKARSGRVKRVRCVRPMP
jgi:hypothetical protein